MRRDVNKEDFQILTDLEYSTEEIYTLLNNSRAYKFKSFSEQYLVEVLSNNYEKVEVIDKDTIHVYRADRGKRLQPLVKVLSTLLNKELTIPDNIYYKVKQRVYESYDNNV